MGEGTRFPRGNQLLQRRSDLGIITMAPGRAFTTQDTLARHHPLPRSPHGERGLTRFPMYERSVCHGQVPEVPACVLFWRALLARTRWKLCPSL